MSGIPRKFKVNGSDNFTSPAAICGAHTPRSLKSLVIYSSRKTFASHRSASKNKKISKSFSRRHDSFFFCFCWWLTKPHSIFGEEPQNSQEVAIVGGNLHVRSLKIAQKERSWAFFWSFSLLNFWINKQWRWFLSAILWWWWLIFWPWINWSSLKRAFY